MAKKKVALMDTVEFNDYAQARDMVRTAEKKRIRILIGLAMAAVSTLCSVLVLTGAAGENWLVVPFLLSLPAYIIGGGLKNAFRTAGRLAKFGWFIAPFPVDIAVGLITLIVSIGLFFLMPVVFVLMNYRQHAKNYHAAKRYLSYYRRVRAAAENAA